MKKVTLKDIANECGTSISLVSKVLSGKPCRVTEDKRDDIIRVANESGYQPKKKAKASGDGENDKKNILAIIIPNLEYSFFCGITTALATAANKRNYEVVIFYTHEDPALERKYLELCRAMNVSGIFIDPCGDETNAEYFDWIKKYHVPLVCIDRDMFKVELDCVTTDNFNAIYKITETLIKKGHKDILFLLHGEARLTTVTKERFEGYSKAMTDHRLMPSKEIIFCKRPIEYQPLINFDRYSAVVMSTSSDIVKMLEIVNRIRNVNEKLDVATIDDLMIPYTHLRDNNFFDHINEDIVIVQQDVEAMAEAALDIMLDNIRIGFCGRERIRKYIPCIG